MTEEHYKKFYIAVHQYIKFLDQVRNFQIKYIAEEPDESKRKIIYAKLEYMNSITDDINTLFRTSHDLKKMDSNIEAIILKKEEWKKKIEE